MLRFLRFEVSEGSNNSEISSPCAVAYKTLKPIAKKVVYVISRDPQFWDPREQSDQGPIEWCLEEELESRLKKMEGPILATGSLYFIAKFKN